MLQGTAVTTLVLISLQLIHATTGPEQPALHDLKLAGHAAAGVIDSGVAAAAFDGPSLDDKQGQVTANLTVVTGSGQGFCFPKSIAADVQKPVDTCDEGFSINVTGVSKTICVKKVYRPVSSCFKSIQCPEGTKSDESGKVCLPPKVRGSLVGMLTVFKVRAALPFKILPALKDALAQAAKSPAKAGWDLPDVNVGDLVKQTAAIITAGKDVAEAMHKKQNPMSVALNSMANINMTDFMEVTPQIDSWISKKLEGLTNINEVTAEVSSQFPDCLYRCCKDDVVFNTTVALASKSCPAGTKLNSLLDVCVSEAGYTPCPAGMTMNSQPIGQPVCVSDSKVSGLDQTKLAVLIKSALHKHQCP